MSDEARADGGDDQIVEHFRKRAIAYSKCGFNTVRANRIMDEELRPSYDRLKRLGDAALRKLLPLTADENPTVRWIAAAFAYDLDPTECRRVLEQVIRQRGINGIMAWAALAERNLDAPPDPPGPLPDAEGL